MTKGSKDKQKAKQHRGNVFEGRRKPVVRRIVRCSWNTFQRSSEIRAEPSSRKTLHERLVNDHPIGKSHFEKRFSYSALTDREVS